VDAGGEAWHLARETMASTTGGEAQDGDLQGSRPLQHDSGVASSGSGVRVDRERETTPAPPSASAEWASFPSERPTSVPTYDVAAVAFETSMRHHSHPKLPLDVAIPTRTSVGAPADLELRASFLLLHVDGQSSVRDIAELTGFPVGDVLTTFLSLTAHGLVELGGTHAVQGVPASGERIRYDLNHDD
jgi:hypothetical protein